MREFLKGLSLDDEVVESIMAEYGKKTQKLIAEKNEAEEIANSLEQEVSNNFNLQDELDDYKARYETLNTDYTNIVNTQKVNDAKVDKQFTKFVMNEVSSLVTDEKNFDDCLSEYLQNNSQYIIKDDTNKGKTGDFFKMGSSVNLNGGQTTPQTPNSIFNDIVLKATGRK